MILFKNDAYTTLAATLSAVATSLTVQSGTGSRFPTPAVGDYFYLTLRDRSSNTEIVKVTARSNDVMTITRAQEGTTARSFAIGDFAECLVTAASLGELRDAALGAANALKYRGVLSLADNPNFPATGALGVGDTYVISVAGKIGGFSGIQLEVGDMIVSLAANLPASDYATVGASWNYVQTNVDGTILGSLSALNAGLGTAARLDQTWYEASVAWDATSIAQAAQSSTTVAVPGAEIGDYVLSSCSISTSGLALQAQVTAQDVVTVYLRNLTGSPVDLASATYYVRVMARQPRR